MKKVKLTAWEIAAIEHAVTRDDTLEQNSKTVLLMLLSEAKEIVVCR